MNTEEKISQKKQLGRTSEVVEDLRGLQEHAEMEEATAETLKITSILTVPDLLFRGYRHPQMSRQFIVTFNQAIHQKEFNEKVRKAFGNKR